MFKRQLASCFLFSWPVHGYVVVTTERANPRLRPRLVLACTVTEAVEKRGYAGVFELASQLSNQGLDLDVRRPTMLTGAVSHYAQFGMIAALPVDDESDALINYLHHDFLDHGTQDPLT